MKTITAAGSAGQASLILSTIGLVGTLALASIPSYAVPPFDDNRDGRFFVQENFVPHISTVPANQGELVTLHVHEKVLRSNVDRKGRPARGKAVLMIHGGGTPAPPVYDLDYQDYSWMEFLSREGYHTFALSQTGYGFSPRPEMRDPCNVNPAQQAVLIPNPLSEPCPPSYPFRLTTNQSDWDEIDRVVDWIRAKLNVPTVSLIGWSAGGTRIGGYAARFPAKVEKLIFYAPSYNRNTPSDPPTVLPAPGFPTTLTIRAEDEGGWNEDVLCPGQLAPGVQDVVWNSFMDYDLIGRTWGSNPVGVMRGRTANPGWGWNAEFAARITAPSLIIIGEFDNPQTRIPLYEDLTRAPNKAFITVECASHQIVWERQRQVLHEASLEWLNSSTVRGETDGFFTANFPNGRIVGSGPPPLPPRQ